MSKKNQHVVPHESGWAVKGAGNSRATSVHGTQREAIAAARETPQWCSEYNNNNNVKAQRIESKKSFELVKYLSNVDVIT